MGKIDWKKPEDRERLWHSSSHVMAAAVKQLYPGTKLAIGPAIEEGFYYDFDVEKPFKPEDLEKIEKRVEEIIKSNERFEKSEVSKKEAMELFKGEPYKIELINELPGSKASIYTTGSFVDLCKGPHIESTLQIGAVKLLRVSGAYWRGSEKNKMLQRIYGISFPDKKQLKQWVHLREEAEKRNHLKLGKELDLFSMHAEAPGCVFIHAKGMVIWNALVGFWREEHRKAGYVEIKTPAILKKTLWEQSGHWDHYKENMYFTQIDGEDFAVKPMNCPGGILVYKTKRHSYKELPLRIAELGEVHRHELSGVLNGLFRVRKFTQDDAHIYCTEEQIEQEIGKVIELVDRFYKAFGFPYQVELSTRPLKAMGSRQVWDRAEDALKKALSKKKMQFKINEGDGAFYGPKIDFHIRDSLGRTWQCATIQLDFSMPEKFGLEYIGSDDKPKRPVMLHRVIYGSMERFLGILIEHYAGAFPLWLSPVQAAVIAISDKHNAYAEKVCREMDQAGIRAELDARNETVSYKVRDWQKQKANYILVVGDREKKQGTVNVRQRNGKVVGAVKVKKLAEKLLKEIESKK
ncbi:MAG: threonine--tRNA ligase [Candidatus Diapherotrites archaeon]|uniref:Threonine--tRNA ligase n=1 Tax=Candidatus Iainarchaeum sp. TaxID=3101447 RepID=A0A939CAK3_9ARCH|nr:threonine--tRNA ligase [Candidatus Diapherotrites archaeon]